jgi:hypothetical protein
MLVFAVIGPADVVSTFIAVFVVVVMFNVIEAFVIGYGIVAKIIVASIAFGVVDAETVFEGKVFDRAGVRTPRALLMLVLDVVRASVVFVAELGIEETDVETAVEVVWLFPAGVRTWRVSLKLVPRASIDVALDFVSPWCFVVLVATFTRHAMCGLRSSLGA